MTRPTRAFSECQLCWFTSVCTASEDGPVILRNICKFYCCCFLFCFILRYSPVFPRVTLQQCGELFFSCCRIIVYIRATLYSGVLISVRV